MFGYFLRRVDTRFQLESALGMLDDSSSQEEAVARLERLFAQVGDGRFTRWCWWPHLCHAIGVLNDDNPSHGAVIHTPARKLLLSCAGGRSRQSSLLGLQR